MAVKQGDSQVIHVSLPAVHGRLIGELTAPIAKHLDNKAITARVGRQVLLEVGVSLPMTAMRQRWGTSGVRDLRR